MGSHEGCSQPNGFYPNGLLPDEAASVTRMLDEERWSLAEERIAELIARIQPDQPSEDRRNAVADYVQQLIAKCFSCQVFTFGSVPLKTYLPDGDIDLTAFSKIQNLKDTWASEVRDMLENEEKSENAEFRVKEVQYIQAEVKIIKCLVENIVVDISFNQLGGLCTLCFLEEVDSLINQNHLFKRSVILIKAWCYYESRILGAHHGLISTYALETLVLYIFHVFNNDFTGPLEVLYRFLEFFSKFDWENFCVSLWGPVPISSLPDVIADPPRKDGGELLLSKVFLRACSTVYSVFPGGQENNELPFISKHFNVIDPLRTNNNLGRSVSKGNFFRIRSAFAFGAKRLARLLDCPKENIIVEIDHFFLNTWDRHGKGHRPDAQNPDIYGLQCLNMNHVNGFDNLRNSSSSKKVKEKRTGHEFKLEENRGSRAANGVLSQQGNQLLKRNSRITNNVAGPQNQKKFASLTCSVASNQNHQMPPGYNSNLNVHIDKGRNCRPDYLGNKMNSRYHFARTHSSPELTEYSEISYQGRHNWASESITEQAAVTRLDYSRRNIGLEASDDNSARSLREEIPSSRQISSLQSIKPAVDSDNASNRYYSKSGLNAMQEDQTSVGDTMQMHQEEQDLVNMMTSSRVHSLGGHFQMPLNLTSAHLPVPLSPSIFASLGYANRNSGGMVPNSTTSFEMPWASQTCYSQGLVSMPVSQFTSSLGMASHHQEEIVEPIEDCLICKETYHDHSDHVQWSKQNAYSLQGFDPDDENFQARQLEEKRPLSSGGSAVISATHLPTPENYLMKAHGSIKEDRSISENYGDNHLRQNTRRSEVHSPSQGSVPAANATSSRSKLSSEGSSCDGLSMKSSKSVRDWGERKSVPSAEHSTVCKHGWQHESDSVDYVFPQVDGDRGEWIPLSTIESEAAEDMVPGNVAPSLMRFHQIPSYEPAELRESYSMVPVAPVPVCSDSRQRTYDNNDALPFAFYPAGPPVPFVTMLPFYNFPTEMGTSDGSGSHFERDEEFNNSHISQYGQRLTENLEHPQCSSQSNMEGTAPVESSGENKSDILNGDFASHWQNLQYGRICQSPSNQGNMFYPSPVVVPPMYIQGHLPWDGPGRPLSANANLFTQLMGYGPGAVPLSSLQPGSNRPGSVYQSSCDEIPRYRGGTGTYLPNPQKLSSRDRQSSNARNNRGDYSNDHKDYNADRDLNWNINSKQRFAGRGQGRSQVERPNTRIDRSIANKSRSDGPRYSFRPDTVHSNHSQNGPISSSNSSRHGSKNVAYGMYPLPVMNPNGVAPSATTVPSVVMFYPYEQNMGCDSPAEQQLKFGSIGPMHFSNLNELVHLGESSSRDAKEQRNIPVDSGHSSPDLPSSPIHQRGV